MDSPAGSCLEGNWLKSYLPHLRLDECKLTSKATWDYNCVGYVAGDYRWWHYGEYEGWYWPDGVKRGKWATAYINALASVGFEICDEKDPEFEPGIEKVAIFHRGGAFKHAALLVRPGIWKSKLGEYEDLEHPFDAMNKSAYGSVFRFLMRPAYCRPTSDPNEYRL